MLVVRRAGRTGSKHWVPVHENEPTQAQASRALRHDDLQRQARPRQTRGQLATTNASPTSRLRQAWPAKALLHVANSQLSPRVPALGFVAGRGIQAPWSLGLVCVQEQLPVTPCLLDDLFGKLQHGTAQALTAELSRHAQVQQVRGRLRTIPSDGLVRRKLLECHHRIDRPAAVRRQQEQLEVGCRHLRAFAARDAATIHLSKQNAEPV
mmetsp:Transcript_61969/g.175250  ORF Transcript_61969/g.175250 Transcript_61969/m.175250 type:complete len:209 (-) Transcript_61969:189-815(-)